MSGFQSYRFLDKLSALFYTDPAIHLTICPDRRNSRSFSLPISSLKPVHPLPPLQTLPNIQHARSFPMIEKESHYPLLRILGAVVGALVGTFVNLLLSPPIYVFRMRSAIAQLMSRLAEGMPELADALAARQAQAECREVFSHMWALEQQVHATQQALSLAVDSARLNPWARCVRRLLIDYPDVLLALERLVRQMRRIAYTINEPELSWSELVQTQEWVPNYARLLQEIGSILASAAQYLRLPATSPQSPLPDREALRSGIEHARQQLYSWQGQLAQDVKQQGALPTRHTESLFIATGVRLAVRGALLTDLPRMLDEVHDVIEMIALPALSEQMEEPAV